MKYKWKEGGHKTPREPWTFPKNVTGIHEIAGSRIQKSKKLHCGEKELEVDPSGAGEGEGLQGAVSPPMTLATPWSMFLSAPVRIKEIGVFFEHKCKRSEMLSTHKISLS